MDACILKALPQSDQIEAATRAIEINPMNRPSPRRILDIFHLIFHTLPVDGAALSPDRLAVMTAKYWGVRGVKLTVGFLDNPAADLQARILLHMNAWGAYCNAVFVPTNTDPQVRIARASDGYWSYLGTDILHIPRGQATMNLQGFTMQTAESEYRRVIRHETGHTLGYPHEHMRQALIDLLDVQKTIAWGRTSLGWNEQTVRQQILTPLSEQSIMGTPNADQDSIMCYQLPGSITKNGQPIQGGVDIDTNDQAFAAKIYPLAINPPPPPPPPPAGGKLVVTVEQIGGKLTPSIPGFRITPLE